MILIPYKNNQYHSIICMTKEKKAWVEMITKIYVFVIFAQLS